jgi:diguanylate cyclase (GGDEF)-like protein/PAS domain S-box-containing protein
MRVLSALDREMAASDRLAGRTYRGDSMGGEVAIADARELEAESRDAAADARDAARDSADQHAAALDEGQAALAEMDRDRHLRNRQLSADRRGFSADDRGAATVDRLEREFLLLAENAADVVVRTGPDHRRTWVSESVREHLGWSPREYLILTDAQLIHPDDAARMAAPGTRDRGDPRGDQLDGHEVRVRHADGGWVWTWSRTSPLPDGGSITSVRVVEAEIQARIALGASESRYRLIADSVGDVVMRVADDTWAWISPSVNAVLGRTPESLVGEPSSDLIHPDDRGAAQQAGRDARGGQNSRIRLRLLGQRGWLWTECNVTPYLDDGGDASGLLIVARDISAQVVTEEAADTALADLAYRSSHDLLTGLRNRYEILEFLGQALDQRRDGGLVAVLFIDVDRFKEINDGISHAAGDVVLTSIADRLRGSMRPTDLIGRLGGDEFAAILTDLQQITDATETAERLREDISRDPFEADGTQVMVSVSIGIATSRRDSTPAKMLSEADAAVYQAKGAGRNRWEIAGEAMRSEAVRRLDVTNRLRAGLAAHEFHAWLQPIIDLRDHEVIGYEALARWTTERGTTEACEFVGIAEDTGLIIELGWVVLAEAIDCLPWLPAHQFLTVNASPSQLSAPGFAGRLKQAMCAVGADPTRLVVEITEHGLLNLGPSSRAGLQSLSEAGVGLYVDDFGTGYSSMSTLRDYPVTGIKLDCSFTQRLSGDPDDPSWRVVSGLSDLAAHLGLSRIAEGVETERQERSLRAAGWSAGQGWLYGHAAPPEHFLSKLPPPRRTNARSTDPGVDRTRALHRRRRNDSRARSGQAGAGTDEP